MKKRKSKNWIDFKTVKQETDFRDVLNFYGLEIQGNGEQLKIHCPFHEDKTPSCKIHTGKKIFHCFGCEAKGNILEFIVLKENGNTENSQDLKKAAEIALKINGKIAPKKPKMASKGKNSENPSPTTPEDENGQISAPKGAINEPLNFALKLKTEHPFLENRNLTPEQILEFGLGYANRGMMKKRICFPLHNEQGELIAYIGRWATEEVPEHEMRYKLPGNFYKSLMLYNLHRVKEKFPLTRHIVLVEGYWSTIRLHTANIPTAGLQGTAISQEQIKLLKEFGINQITLILDGDEAGRKALKSMLPILTQTFFVKSIVLPEGIKPDTMDDEILENLQD